MFRTFLMFPCGSKMKLPIVSTLALYDYLYFTILTIKPPIIGLTLPSRIWGFVILSYLESSYIIKNICINSTLVQLSVCRGNVILVQAVFVRLPWWRSQVQLAIVNTDFWSRRDADYKKTKFKLCYTEMCHNQLDCFCFVLNLVEQN